MAIARRIITENDYVELTCPVGKWAAGTRGTAVSDHGDSKLIEVADDLGQMLDLFEVPESKLRRISSHPSRLPDQQAR